MRACSFRISKLYAVFYFCVAMQSLIVICPRLLLITALVDCSGEHMLFAAQWVIAGYIKSKALSIEGYFGVRIYHQCECLYAENHHLGSRLVIIEFIHQCEYITNERYSQKLLRIGGYTFSV